MAMVKRVLQCVGLAVVFLVSYALLSKLSRLCGPTPAGMIAMFSLGMAAWVAGPEARMVAKWAEDALSDLKLSKQAAALSMSPPMTEAQLSRQINCIDQFSMSRWSTIPHFAEFFSLQVLKSSGNYTVVENGILARLVNKLEDLYHDTATSRRIA